MNYVLLSFTNINVKFGIKIELSECSHKFNVLFDFRSDVVLYEICVSSGISLAQNVCRVEAHSHVHYTSVKCFRTWTQFGFEWE